MTIRINQDRLTQGIGLLVGTMLVMAGAAQASVRVGGWSMRANGQVAQGFQYIGSCPVDLKFEWGLISTEPTTVTYVTDRNDHSEMWRRSINVPAANRTVPVYMDWRLGANTPAFENYSGWVQLNIQSPNSVTQRIAFTIHCTAGSGVRIGALSLRANGQAAHDFQYTGSCPVDLRFGWGVIASLPTTVTYSTARNDGAHSSYESLNIPAAYQSVPVYMDWRLGANRPEFANYRGWAELRIESPRPVSQKIPFTLHCGNK